MLAVFQLSALKAQGNSYKPVENYTFVEKDGKRYQEIRLVDKVDVFNEKKRDEYIKEIEVKYGYNTDLKQSYCYIKEKKVDFDRRGDYASASGFCLSLYSDLKCGYGPIWGLGDLSPKEFKKNLKTVMAYRRTRYVPKHEEISYYRRIAETVEHHIDSALATCVNTVTVVRKIYMPVDINDTIVSYSKEVSFDADGVFSKKEIYSWEWFEAEELGEDRFAFFSEDKKELCYVRMLARYGEIDHMKYGCPISFGCYRIYYKFNFKYKNGDYVNGVEKLYDQYSREPRPRYLSYEEVCLTKDKGVYKGSPYELNFVLDNGDIIKGCWSRDDDVFFYNNHFPTIGEFYSASGEFKDKLVNGKWESELKAEEEARKKAKEAAAQAEMEALRKELVAKYGEKMANAYLEGELMVGMPEELLDKFMDRYNYRYLGKTNWSGDTIRYRYARSLIFSVEEVYLYVRNGKLVDFTIYND